MNDLNRESESDIQSPITTTSTDMILEEYQVEPEAVEMMDESEESDDDDDEDESDDELKPSQTKSSSSTAGSLGDNTTKAYNNNNNNTNNDQDLNQPQITSKVSTNNNNEDQDELEDEDRKRFQIELEFVQSLANPNYLNFLAQRGYFKNETFINYLKYLMYWKKPEYCKYLMYPQCLSLLEMLQHEKFLKEIVNAACSKYIDEQILLIWLHYKTRRDWIRIDPSKLPDNIEKLFKKSQNEDDGDTSECDEQDAEASNETNHDNNDNNKENNFHENNRGRCRRRLNANKATDLVVAKDPFLASLFIENEKF